METPEKLLTVKERQAMRHIQSNAPKSDFIEALDCALDDIDARERRIELLQKKASDWNAEADKYLRERDEARADYQSLAKEYGRA